MLHPASVLIADDEIMLREIAAEALRDEGFLVFQAAHGREALSLLKRNPGIALLISDVRMPEMDGWALADAALEFRPDLKILLMTGYDQTLEPGTIHFPRFEVLKKPFNLQALCDRARQITGQDGTAPVPLDAQRFMI